MRPTESAFMIPLPLSPAVIMQLPTLATMGVESRELTS